MTPEQITELSVKYGSKSGAYRAAVKAGLTVYVVHKAFGVTKINIASKCYTGVNRPLFDATEPMSKEDCTTLLGASGVTPRTSMQRARATEDNVQQLKRRLGDAPETPQEEGT